MNHETGSVPDMEQAVNQSKIPVRTEVAVHHQETGGRFGSWLYRVLSDPQPRITEQGQVEHVRLVLPRKQDSLDRLGQRLQRGSAAIREQMSSAWARSGLLFQRPMEAGFTAQAFVADRDPNTPVAAQSENTAVLTGIDASSSDATAR